MRRSHRRMLLLVGASALAAALAFAVVGRSTPETANEAAARLGVQGAGQQRATDSHGFPRTLSNQQCGNLDWVARNDMVIGYAYCNIAKLRKLDPKAIFLLNPGVYPSGYHDGEADYGGMNITYGSGLHDWKGLCDKLPGGVNLGCIRGFNFDKDYLHNADGSYATIDGSADGHRGWNLPDQSTRLLVAQVMAYAAKLDGLYSRGWDGIWSDNWIYGVIGRSWAYGPNLDTNGDGKVDDYATLRREWDNGLNWVGSKLRSYLPGKIVGGNGNWYAAEPGQYFGSDPNGWLKSANLTMVESVERLSDDVPQLLRISSRWLSFRDPKGQPRYLLFVQNAQMADGSRLVLPSGADPNEPKYMLDPAVMRSMRWGLTLSLMAGAYYRIVVNGNSGTDWWYDEYDGGKGVRRRNYLGQATGPARSVAKDVWRRDFDRGIALNNSSGRSVTISLHGRFRHLRGAQDPKVNDGRVVTSVRLQPHDGVILLRPVR